jgi:hypothetical protein
LNDAGVAGTVDFNDLLPNPLSIKSGASVSQKLPDINDILWSKEHHLETASVSGSQISTCCSPSGFFCRRNLACS